MSCDVIGPLRSRREIILAHDRLVLILRGTIPNPFSDANSDYLDDVVNVLCWVLRHDPNGDEFQANMDLIDDAMRENGFKISLVEEDEAAQVEITVQ